MLKKLFENSLIYGLSSIATRGVSLLMLPFYTRVFSPGDYGLIDLINILGALVSLTVALEIAQGVARCTVEAPTEALKARYVSTGLCFTMLMNGVFLIAAFAWAGPIHSGLLGGHGPPGLVAVGALAIAANGLFYFLQSQLRWQSKAKAYAIASLVFTAVSISCTFAAVLGMNAGVLGVFLGTLAGALMGGWVAWRLAPERYRLVFDPGLALEMLRFSGPLVPSSVAVFVSLYVDRLAIKELLTLRDLGLYGVGYRFASVVGLLLIGVQSSLTPLIFERYRDPGTPEALARIFGYFLALALGLVLALTLFASDLVGLFTTPTYMAAASVVPLLALSLMLSEMYIFAPGLSLAKKTHLFPVINGSTAALSVGLNLVLIPLLGFVGAALAMLVSAGVNFGVHLTVSQRYYPVPHRWRALALALCGFLAIAASTQALPAVPGLTGPGLLLLKAGLLVAGLAWLAGHLVGLSEWRRLTARWVPAAPAPEKGSL